MILGTINRNKISDVKIDGLDKEYVDSSVKLAILTVLAGYLEKNAVTVNGNRIIDESYLNSFLSYLLNDLRAAPITFKLDIGFNETKRSLASKTGNQYDLLLSFSGGVDSTAGLLLALDQKLNVMPVFICFGQKNEAREISSVKIILKKLGIKPLIVKVNITKYMDQDWKRWRLGIIPARNYLFAAVAGSILSRSKKNKLKIWICAHKEEINPINTDKSNRFFRSVTKILTNTYKREVLVATPFKLVTKPEIVSYWHKFWEKKYNIFVSDTTSCYFGINCGLCKACINRAIAFTCAGIEIEAFQVNPFKDQKKIIQREYIDRFNSLKLERRLDFLYSMHIHRNDLPSELKLFLDTKYKKYIKRINKRIDLIRDIDKT